MGGSLRGMRVSGVLFLDLLLVMLAFALACGFGGSGVHHLASSECRMMFFCVFICAVTVAGLVSPDADLAPGSFGSLVGRVAVRGFVLCFLLAVMLWLLDIGIDYRLLLRFAAVLTTLLLAVRIVAARWRKYRRYDDAATSRCILVVGSHGRAQELLHYLEYNAPVGYRVVGCLESDGERERIGMEVCAGVKVIDTMANFDRVLTEHVIDEIIFAVPLKKIADVAKHISLAEQAGINVRILPDWQLQEILYSPEVASVYVSDFVGIPTQVLSSLPQRRLELAIKGIFDRSAAVVALVLLSPLLLLIAVAIKLTSEGPVLFAQRRCGLNGREFTLYKFRTMVVNAEQLREQLLDENEMDGPVFKISNDPRITRIGALLRKTSLDELPQLLNIVKGEMSFVGPRPPLPSEVKEYEVWQRRRLSVRPGLTCIWQVSGRNNISFEQWMRMDLEYIDQWSFLLDVKLILRTVPAVVFGTGR